MSVRLLPKSKKKRIVKKWFKRTGNIRCKCLGRNPETGLFMHKAELPAGLWPLFFSGRQRPFVGMMEGKAGTVARPTNE